MAGAGTRGARVRGAREPGHANAYAAPKAASLVVLLAPYPGCATRWWQSWGRAKGAMGACARAGPAKGRCTECKDPWLYCFCALYLPEMEEGAWGCLRCRGMRAPSKVGTRGHGLERGVWEGLIVKRAHKQICRQADARAPVAPLGQPKALGARGARMRAKRLWGREAQITLREEILGRQRGGEGWAGGCQRLIGALRREDVAAAMHVPGPARNGEFLHNGGEGCVQV